MAELVFFTKTCARDWKRCCYQMLAIRRLFPLTRHIVMIEQQEFLPTYKRDNIFECDPTKIWRGCEGLRGPVLSLERAGLTLIVTVDRWMPEAMTIEDPNLRQQYVKLRAPIVFGVDMIQIDSDMCPKPMQTRWADELYPVWHYYEYPKQYKDALTQWAEAYYALIGLRCEPGLLFMGSQYGWYIRRDTAREFFCALGQDFLERASMRSLREPQRVVDRLVEHAERGFKFSEYQLFGQYVWQTWRTYGAAWQTQAYRFQQLHDLPSAHPISKIGDWSWLLHFSSKEPLEPEQEAQLRKAAGLEES